MQNQVLIVGAGGFGRSVAEAILLGGPYQLAGFVDDRGPELGKVLGQAVLGRLADLPTLRRQFGLLVVAIGHNRRRREVFLQALQADFQLVGVVHPRAWVSAHARLDEGALVMAGAIVGTEAHIGEGAIVNAGAVVDHHGRVGAFAHLGVGACMGGGAVLGAGAWLHEGVALRAGREVLPDAEVAQSGC